MKAPTFYKRALDFARRFVDENKPTSMAWSEERLVYNVRRALVRFDRSAWTKVSEDPATLPPEDATRLLVIVRRATRTEVMAIARTPNWSHTMTSWSAGLFTIVFRAPDVETPKALVALAWRLFPNPIDLDETP